MSDMHAIPSDVLGDVVVAGAGKTGLVATDYLIRLAPERMGSVTLVGGASSYETDATRALAEAGVDVRLATEEVEGSFDLAVVSPGIPESSAFFSNVRAASKEVVGEVELAWRESPERWIAITGTNGKTTTTLLATSLLEAGGLKAQAVGNVGTVAIGEVATRPAGSWFVSELSSFQLATATRLHPRVACLLNITPDHVEWHGSLEAYAAAKERVFQALDAHDLAVVSVADDWCRKICARLEARGLRVCRVSVHDDPGTPCAAFVRDGRLVCRLDGCEQVLVGCESLALRGEHNWQNALVASVAALEVGVTPAAVIHGLLNFAPLEHRIEPCGELDGVRYVNDSKGTNVDATIAALAAFRPGRICVLLGGHDKGTDLDDLAHAVSARCRVAVCYGEAGERIARAIEAADDGMGLTVVLVPHMADALAAARERAREGEVVLLSPACSSFDEFGSYVERGRVFKELVAEMVGGHR